MNKRQNAAMAGSMLSMVGGFGGLAGQGGAIAGQAASLGGSLLASHSASEANNAMMKDCL